MIAIQTLYRPATEKLGASIIARAEYGCSVARKSIPYPYEYGPEEAHRAAALSLIDWVNSRGGAWPTNIVTGCLPDASYCHVLQH